MGGVCSSCFKSKDQQEKAFYQAAPQLDQSQQRSSDGDRARSDEARANAAIAAQKR